MQMDCLCYHIASLDRTLSFPNPQEILQCHKSWGFDGVRHDWKACSNLMTCVRKTPVAQEAGKSWQGTYTQKSSAT